jgi:uncharacterized membrane protein YedE/YeeE
MGPLYPQELLSTEYNLLIGFLIGIGFGFLLEAAGFTSTRKLAGVFYGYDATVIKVFFTAALTALIGLFILHFMGWIDITATFFPKTFWIPTLVGGAIMGAGFIIGGFCPGTSLSAAATGKIDAIVFIIGVLGGIFGFIFSYDAWEGLRKSGNMGNVNITEWLGINEGAFIFIFVVVAAVTFVIFQRWQDHWKDKMSQEDIDDLGI